MLRIFNRIGMAVMIGLCIAKVSWAKECEDVRALIDSAVKNRPETMTEQYFQAAIKQCPNKPTIYFFIGEYYSNVK